MIDFSEKVLTVKYDDGYISPEVWEKFITTEYEAQRDNDYFKSNVTIWAVVQTLREMMKEV